MCDSLSTHLQYRLWRCLRPAVLCVRLKQRRRALICTVIAGIVLFGICCFLGLYPWVSIFVCCVLACTPVLPYTTHMHTHHHRIVRSLFACLLIPCTVQDMSTSSVAAVCSSGCDWCLLHLLLALSIV